MAAQFIHLTRIDQTMSPKRMDETHTFRVVSGFRIRFGKLTQVKPKKVLRTLST